MYTPLYLLSRQDVLRRKILMLIWAIPISILLLSTSTILLTREAPIRTPHIPSHTAIRIGSPRDMNIRYAGRRDESSSAVYISYWPGAYFKTNFTGKQ